MSPLFILATRWMCGRREMKLADQMSSVEKNWIALEREGETPLVNTQILISCGWPADCINIQLLFESCRHEIWTWMLALQEDGRARTPPLTQRHTWSDPWKTWWPEALFNVRTDTSQIHTGSLKCWPLRCFCIFGPDKWIRPVSEVTKPKVRP